MLFFRKNVAFGKVIHGMKILQDIEDIATDNGRPSQKVVIIDCGEVLDVCGSKRRYLVNYKQVQFLCFFFSEWVSFFGTVFNLGITLQVRIHIAPRDTKARRVTWDANFFPLDYLIC